MEDIVSGYPSIDRTSEVPYYEQLYRILREQVLGEALVPDERLPSEQALCRQFGLSRATVRQALSRLESEGFVRRVAGRGVYVSSPDKQSGWTVQDPQGFLELQIRQGKHEVKTQVVGSQFVIPPLFVSEALHLGRGETVYALERERYIHGQRALFSTNWFPGEAGRVIAAAGDVLDGSGSVNATLERAGFNTYEARRSLEALGAPESVAQHLGIASGDPVLRVRSVSWDQAGKAFDYYETWVLTHVVPLEIHVSAT
ncbi:MULTISPECIES: GntR family transcriptional regulator [unclassified Luteococcus]|uniref:GntR family transcriptional regulator n=1 Tax=unclassified Luteococcus TaxID=2639923 RepID=UPI00313B10DE